MRRLKSTLTLLLTSLLVAGLMLASATPQAHAKKGLGGLAVGLAAGMVIGGALSNAAKSQPKRRPAKKRRTYRKKKTYTKKKTYRTKKTYSKKRSSRPTRRAKSRTRQKRSRSYARSAPSVDVGSSTYQVKSALAALGLLSGSLDDNRDSDFTRSVKAYQAQKRIAATGVLDPTQRQLLMQEAEGRSALIALGSPNAPFRGDEGDKRIQRALAKLGYYDGAIDGKIGRGSRRAIAAYQADRGLPTTGDLATPKAKSDLVRTARQSIETNMAAINAQFASIRQQQFATLKPAQPAAPATQPTQTAVATPKVVTGVQPTPAVATPAQTSRPVTKTALPSTAAGFAPIEPVKVDAPIRRPMDVAVIIGNRDYKGDIPDVAYGHRDADAVKSLMVNDLGFSPSNIIDARDAGQAELVSIFGSKSNNRGKVWRLIDPDGNSNVFVFYSGHGAPDTQSNTPYLMPVDSHPDTIQLNGYPLSQMYANLESLEVQSVAVFLDACFSGGSAGGMLTKSASPVAVTAKMPVVKTAQKLTVLAAAEGDQLASWNEKKGFGLFTNHLVDGLRGKADTDGNQAITAGELHSYVHDKVRRSARREFGRIQTPVLMGRSDYVLRADEKGLDAKASAGSQGGEQPL